MLSRGTPPIEAPSGGRRTALPAAAGLLPAGALYGLAVITANPWLALVASAVVVLPLAGGRHKTRVGYRWPRPITVGDTVPFTVTVTNTGWRVAPGAVLVERTPGFAPIEIAVPPLRPGEAATLGVHRVALARGVGSGRCELRSIGFFVGHTTHVVRMPGAPVIVRPRPDEPPEPPPSAARGATSPVGRPSARGLSVAGARPWRPGDPTSAVHWRSTARAGHPVVLEREDEPGVERLLVVCDGGSGPRWETAVSLAAGVVAGAARDGGRCRIVAAPPAADPPDGTDEGAALDWLAGLDRAGSLLPAQAADVVAAARGGAAVHVLADSGSTDAPALIAAVRAAGGWAAALDSVAGAGGIAR